MRGQELHHVYLRLSPREIEIVHRLAEESGLPVSPAIRRLIRESDQPAINQMSRKFDIPPNEVDLHLLVAIEQVLALMESFLPRGQGAASRVLPEAVLAAQRRLELGGGEDQ